MSTETLKKAAIVCFIIAMGGLLLGGVVANREAPLRIAYWLPMEHCFSPKRTSWQGRMYTSVMD